MFTKPARPDTGAGTMKMDPQIGKKSPKIASLIADSVAIKGDVSGDAELHVDGVITGDVTVTRLMIGERGKIEGAITADSVEVRGTITGSIEAKHVHLFATASVNGDITQDQLVVDAGANFEGRSLKMQSAAIHILAEAAADAKGP